MKTIDLTRPVRKTSLEARVEALEAELVEIKSKMLSEDELVVFTVSSKAELARLFPDPQ